MQVAPNCVCSYNYNGKHKNNVQHKQVGSGCKAIIQLRSQLIQDVFVTMQTTPSLFKTLTNFILSKFNELNNISGPHHLGPCNIHL